MTNERVVVSQAERNANYAILQPTAHGVDGQTWPNNYYSIGIDLSLPTLVVQPICIVHMLYDV